MRTAIALLVFGAAVMAGSTEAQTLNVRPAPLADMRAGRPVRHGEVLLGQTTLEGALRMFAEELLSDSVRVPRGHPGNPAPMPEDVVWGAAGYQVRPRHHLDLGPERYTLFFDENERLIVATTGRLPGGLTLKVLRSHYPSLRQGRRWDGGDQHRSDEWSAAVSRCVTIVANLPAAGQRVESLSYYYTCPTARAAARRTTSSR